MDHKVAIAELDFQVKYMAEWHLQESNRHCGNDDNKFLKRTLIERNILSRVGQTMDWQSYQATAEDTANLAQVDTIWF